MAAIVKPYTFSAGSTIIAAEHNSNFDIIYADYSGNIDNTNIAASAGIVDSKLAAITTASKVNGSALYSLASVTSGAGLLPTYSLGTGTTGNNVYLRGDGIWATVSTAGGSVTIDASQVVSGYFTSDRLASGTTSSTVFLRGDLTWATPTDKVYSHTIFSFGACGDTDSTNYGFCTGTTKTSPVPGYGYWYNVTSSYVTVLRSYFRKIVGVNTVTVYAYLEGSGAVCQVDIGGASSTLNGSSPAWVSTTINVSALTTGSDYQVQIQLKSSGKLYSIVGLAS